MSCRHNANKAGSAGVQAGLSKLASQLSYVAGALAANLADGVDWTANARGRMAAPVAAAVTGQPTTARRGVGRVAGGVWWAAGLAPEIRAAKKIVKGVESLSGLAGNVVGAAGRKAEAETRQVRQKKRTLLFFKSQTPVTLWKSSLTEAINRRDAPPGTGRAVVSSEGVMFKVGGRTWHRGTMTADLPAGRRTVTHLQSLAIPSPHYYFDRPVSDEHAVGVATNQVKPEESPGYVGQVSQLEELCTVWAQTKHSLLKTRLYWPSGDNKEPP